MLFVESKRQRVRAHHPLRDKNNPVATCTGGNRCRSLRRLASERTIKIHIFFWYSSSLSAQNTCHVRGWPAKQQPKKGRWASFFFVSGSVTRFLNEFERAQTCMCYLYCWPCVPGLAWINKSGVNGAFRIHIANPSRFRRAKLYFEVRLVWSWILGDSWWRLGTKRSYSRII